MRDFRDAKAMAQTLRQALSDKSVTLTHSESLELVARLFGLRDWNVLAARIEAGAAGQAKGAPAPSTSTTTLPVVAMRDIVVFPEMTSALFVARPKTVRAVERAMAGDGRVLLLTQKRREDEDPGGEGLHQVGIVAEILQILHNAAPAAALPEARRTPLLPEGTLKLMLYGRSRARVATLTSGELLTAEVEPIATTGEQGAEALAREAVEAFARFKRIDPAAPPQALASLAWAAARPGALADVIAPQLSISLDQAQDLLATADAAERLRKVLAIMEADRKAA